MSEEITVFDIPDQETIINKSQKQLEYESMEQKTKINKHHINVLYEMDEYIEHQQKPKSTLISIMLKWLLQYCMPITTKEEPKYFIALQNETQLYGIEDGKYISIPSGIQFKVIGIILPNLFVKKYNKRILAHYDHVDDNQLSLSGHFGLMDYQTYNYTQQRDIFTHPGLPVTEGNNILFKDDQNTGVFLKDLLSYIEYIETYYNVNFPAIRYDLIKPDVEGSSYKKWHIVNGLLLDNIHDETPSLTKKSDKKEIKSKLQIVLQQKHDKLFNQFASSVLDILNKAQNSNFGTSFYYDILYMLEKNGLIHAYNIAEKIGIDDSIFKKELTNKQTELTYKLAYEKQVYEGYAKQSDLIKLKTIAFEKYGEYDLSKLDKKQKDTVDLEFKKINAKISSTDPSIMKLFAKLRKSFLDQEPDELKRILKEIENTVDKKQLDGFELLISGVCPHVYNYGVKMLENFGKPWLGSTLRDYMIQNYALPEDRMGYFCKICGEKVSDPDNTATMKIFGEKRDVLEEDPVQTMIWKEAMYIVSNNIRLLTPVPIKPLINSLASGLRNIIMEEEAKLYRSKTSTGESIKDTLNLYAAIYIYAALCALMLNNPGKMMFAREKSSEKNNHRNQVKSDYLEKSNKKNKSEEITKNITTSENTDESADADTEDNITSEFIEDKIDNEDETDNEDTRTIKGTSEKNKRRKTYKYIRGGKAITDIKLAEKFYLNTALKLILLSKETIISRLRNMNMDVIKQIFLKNAYSWATKHAKPIKVDSDNIKQTLQNPLLIDPFYEYTYYSKRLSRNHGSDKYAPYKFDDIKGVLGRPEEKVLQDMNDDINPYETVKPPSKWYPNERNVSDYKNMFHTYTYDSFISMLEYEQQKIYQKSFVPKHVQVVEFLDKWKYLLDMEDKILNESTKSRIRPNIYIELHNDIVGKYNNFSSDRLDLAQHFCPSGELHKVETYIYTDGKKEHEYSKKDIVEWLENKNIDKLKQFSILKVINERCGKCKSTIRDAKSTDKSDKSLSVVFKKADDILAFYQYFETRCPKGNLHDFQNNVCNKCSMHTDYSKKNDKGYYDKYVSIFNKVQLEKQTITINSLEHIRKENESGHTEKNQIKEKYQYSLKKTAEWSQLLDVKYNILVNIGLSEGIKYVDIENSRVNPSKNESTSKIRFMKLIGYIHTILREYHMILNHEKIVDMPLELKEILDAQKKIDIKDLQKSMPTFDNFAELNVKYKYSLNINDYTNFLQEYLADIIVRISKESTEKYSTMSKLLIKHFTNIIITSEKILSKPDPIFAKMDITTLEEGSEDEGGISGDDWAGKISDQSEPEGDEEHEVESYDNDINNDGYDVENADDIWEND